jgi:hypothetical protein
MSEGIGLPVIAGLSVGIAFVLMFSLAIGNSFFATDDQIIASANSTPEAKVFFSEYPDGKVLVDKTGNVFGSPVIMYSYEKTYEDGKINEVRMLIGLHRLTGMPDYSKMGVECSVSYVGGLGAITAGEAGSSISEVLKIGSCAK